MRRKVIAANYKMNKTVSEVEEFLNKIKNRINVIDRDVIICPNILAINKAYEILKDTNVKVGIQNIHTEDKGAYTGETSVIMAKDAGASYAICGHSERRQYFGETDEIVNKKVLKCIENNIGAILCVGENLDQRNKNLQFDTVKKQVVNGLKNVELKDLDKVIVAYEPIWAIGTGVTASKEQAEEICKYIREELIKLYGPEGNEVRVLYGGSVSAKTSYELLNMPNIDGALIGSASLKEEFVDIVNTDIN